MKKGYGYIRCSTIGQAEEGFTLENQKRAIQEYCKIHDIHLVHIFEDGGRSGRTIKRPEFQEMLAKMEAQHIESIIIYKIDRFARNVSDFSRILSELKEKKIELYSLQEGNLTSSSSLVPNIFASVAQWESEVNGERTKDALQQKFRNGWQPTPPPCGYVSIGGEGEQKTCEIDSHAGPVIKQMFQLYSSGQYTMISLQEWLQDKNILSKNGTIISFSRINNTLNNPFYYGLIRWHGEAKMGKHTPLISKQLFDKCQFILEKHRHFLLREHKYDFLLRGFLYCPCGMRNVGDVNTIRSNKQKVYYYHCQKRYSPDCKEKYAHAKEIEAQVEGFIKKLEFDEDFLVQLRQHVGIYLATGKRDINTVRQTLINQKTAIVTRRNKLEDLLIDGAMDSNTYKRKHAELSLQISNLETQAEVANEETKLDMPLLEQTLFMTKDIYSTYKRAPDPVKRHYIRFFYEKFIVSDRTIIKAIPTPIFEALLNANMVRLSEPVLPG